jgi:RNA polymerase sigma factor (sigma-70 family)
MIYRKPRRESPLLDVLWRTGTMTGLSDAQLLRMIGQARDSTGELAFRELIHRHGPMVLSVCRQVLRHSHDVDDAFQATFLVLVRRAQSISVGESVGPWLCSVAYRTAQRARAVASRYRPGKLEQLHADEEPPVDADPFTIDLRPLLYEELGRLPERYRAPIVLCHLEGKTHEQAARLLEWPVGTLSGRLSRGRQLLRARLERRGVQVPATLLCAHWLSGAQSLVSTPLVECALKTTMQFAAAKTVSLSVLSLTHGVLRTMLLRKLTTAAAVLLIGAISGGAIVAAHRPSTLTGDRSQEGKPTAVSSDNTEAAPAPIPNSGPRPSSQIKAGTVTNVADNCPGDCSGDCFSDGPPPWCPITIAANAITNMIDHLHDWSRLSR